MQDNKRSNNEHKYAHTGLLRDEGWVNSGVGNLWPAGRMRPARPPEGKNDTDEYFVYAARVVGVARDKNHNSFSAGGG